MAEKKPPAKWIRWRFGGALRCFGASKCEDSLAGSFSDGRTAKMLLFPSFRNLKQIRVPVNPSGHVFWHLCSYVEARLELIEIARRLWLWRLAKSNGY